MDRVSKILVKESSRVHFPLDSIGACSVIDISADDTNYFISISAPFVEDEGTLVELALSDKLPRLHDEYLIQTEGVYGIDTDETDPNDPASYEEWVENGLEVKRDIPAFDGNEYDAYDEFPDFNNWIYELVDDTKGLQGYMEMYLGDYIRANEDEYSDFYCFLLGEEDYVFTLIFPKDDYPEASTLVDLVGEIAFEFIDKGIPENGNWQQTPPKEWYGFRRDLWPLEGKI